MKKCKPFQQPSKGNRGRGNQNGQCRQCRQVLWRRKWICQNCFQSRKGYRDLKNTKIVHVHVKSPCFLSGEGERRKRQSNCQDCSAIGEWGWFSAPSPPQGSCQAVPKMFSFFSHEEVCKAIYRLPQGSPDPCTAWQDPGEGGQKITHSLAGAWSYAVSWAELD